MSISASTTSVDSIVLGGPGKSLFEKGQIAVNSSISTWNQGDLICFDSGALGLRPVSATGDGLTIVGIADNVVVSGKLAGPYDGLTAVNAAQSTPGFVGPKYGVVARMKLHLGDAFTMGCKVYLSNGDDCQTVSVTNPGDGNYVGIFQDLPVASAVAGQTAACLLGARYPAAAATSLQLG